jgi:uncharacterized protein involved in type VI secretion and phage assembly
VLHKGKPHFRGGEKSLFFIQDLPADTFHVHSFVTQGGINRCCRNEIMVISERDDLDLKTLVNSTAFCVILSELEQRHRFKEYVPYRMVMASRLWFLAQTIHNPGPSTCSGKVMIMK